MTLWRPVSEQVWQGRDDSAEASNATRIFQTIRQQAQFAPGTAVQLAFFALHRDAGVIGHFLTAAGE